MDNRTFFLAGGPLLACLCAPLAAQPPAGRMSDHPAVAVQRLQAQKTYDYAAQFYPHPAWLYLRPAAEEAVTLARPAPAARPAVPAAPVVPGITAEMALARQDVE